MVVLASAGSLKESVVDKRISESFDTELILLFSIQPLFLSQDQVSFAEDTEFGEVVICTSSSTWGEKSWMFCGDVLFWLLLAPQEVIQDPDFCLEESPIVRQLDWGGWLAGVAQQRERCQIGRRGWASAVRKFREKIHYF